MNRKGAVVVLTGLLLAAGCARAARSSADSGPTGESRMAGSPPAAAPSVASSDAMLEGSFRWVELDGRPSPINFPPGSPSTILDGTLELRGAAVARAGPGGRFGLRFTMSPSPSDSARSTGEDGGFRIVGDSLYFTPDGREDRPPVRFRYAWRPDGRLALTDTQGHVWLYVRR